MASEPQPTPAPPNTASTPAAASAAAHDSLASNTTNGAQSPSASTATGTASLTSAVANLTVDNSKPKVDTAATMAPKNVKIEAADVAFLVDELDLTKARATELLKTHGGERGAALRAFVAPGRA